MNSFDLDPARLDPARLETFILDNVGGDEATDGDQVSAKIIADLYEQALQCRTTLRMEGILVAGADGTAKEHPASRAYRSISAELRAWMKQRPELFGMSNGNQVEEDDELKQFLGPHPA